MKYDETSWDVQPRAGWDAFQHARQRVGDRMWVDSQLHNIVREGRREILAAREATAPDCQVRDATD